MPAPTLAQHILQALFFNGMAGMPDSGMAWHGMLRALRSPVILLLLWIKRQ